MSKIALLTMIISTLMSININAKNKNIVYADKVEKIELFDKFSYPARVISKINSTMLSESQGVIGKLNIKLGSVVNKGQVLVSVRHTDPAYNFREVILKAPVSGMISNIVVTEGTLVAKGNKILTITDPNRLRVLVEIPASDLKYIKTNNTGSLRMNYLDKDVGVVVSGVSPVLDPGTGTATAILYIVNPADIAHVKIGTIGKAEFKSNQRFGFSVAEHSVVYEGRKPHLRIVEENKLKRIPITLGKKRSGNVEVLSGLKGGESVIKRVNGYIADGAEVVTQ